MKLRFSGPTFYHEEDENSFFVWIYKLPGYEEISGESRELELTLSDDIEVETYTQLVAIFKRWGIENTSLNYLREALEAKQI